MQTITVRDLDEEVKHAEKAVEATEKLIHDLWVQTSVTLDDETAKRFQMRIAPFTYRLNQEKQVLHDAQERLRRTKADFQRFGERNTL